MAVNCCIAPWAIEKLDGVTAIETNVAEVTVSVVDPAMLPDDAETAVEPAAVEVASPELLIAATFGLDELQIT